jgi:hypothetical protein
MSSQDSSVSVHSPAFSAEAVTSNAKGKTFISKVDLASMLPLQGLRCCDKKDSLGRPDPCMLHVDLRAMLYFREQVYLRPRLDEDGNDTGEVEQRTRKEVRSWQKSYDITK